MHGTMHNINNGVNEPSAQLVSNCKTGQVFIVDGYPVMKENFCVPEFVFGLMPL